MEGRRSSVANRKSRIALAVAIVSALVLLLLRSHLLRPHLRPLPQPEAPTRSPLPPGFPVKNVWYNVPLRLGDERPGIRVYDVGWHLDMVGAYHSELWADAHGHWKRIRSHADLRGLVRIQSQTDALNYARLGTTFPSLSCATLDDGGYFHEVETTAELPIMPTFGLAPPYKLEDVRVHPPPYGVLGQSGVISADDFRVGGFSPAEVRRSPGGFVVTRWLTAIPREMRSKPVESMDAWNPDGYFVYLVREFVGEDGSFRRQILRSKSAPRLAGTRWSGVHINL